MQLHNARGSGGTGGPAAISFTELLAWQQMTGVDLNPWEVETLQALDRVALQAHADQQQPT